MTGKIILIDGNSLVNRAFYALPPFSTSKGEPTNAIYGFLTMLLKLLEEEDPQCIAVAFDRRAPTFRHKAYDLYKAHRTGMPDSLGVQIPVLKEVLGAFRIPIFEIDGYEADDILATVAARAEKAGLETVIVTGDRDALQLITPKTRCMLTRKGISDVKVVGEKELMEDYGLTPKQVVDLKGLMGDASDNIPGVPGVGEKTASRLLKEFEDMEGIMANLDKVKGEKLRHTLKEWKEQALMSKDLATLVRDVPVEVSLKECQRQPFDRERLVSLFERLEFRTLMEKLDLAPAQATNLVPLDVRVVGESERFDPGDIVEVVAEFSEDKGLEGVGIFPVSGQGVYIPGVQEARVLEILGPLAGDAGISKRGYRIKPLITYLTSRGILPRGFDFDAEVAAYLLDPTRSSYRIEDIAREYVGCGITPLKEILGTGRSRRRFSEIDPPCAASYMAEVAAAVRKIREPLLDALEKAGMTYLFREVEIPLIPVLAGMEAAGIDVDPDQLSDMTKELENRIEEAEAEIYHLAGMTFNINSTRQLGEVLFERLELPVIKKTKTGYSTDAEVLERLALHHDIASKVLEYRQMVKLKSTYTDGLRAMVNPNTGRIHTTFHQTITATGRLSSAEPNLQNIPVRMDLGRRIRRVFRAKKGHLLLAGDYSQIELRVLAHLSGDEVLMEAFHRGEDIHARTAAEVFGVGASEVTPEMRSRAKAVNFGIVYGISDFGLAKDIGVSKSEAGRYIQGYFQRYQGVRSFIARAISGARTNGYVSTLLGRRRPIPDIDSRNPVQRGFAERTAMNTPIQGSAADIIKVAMLRIHRRLIEEEMDAQMILQVHDELIFEVPEGEVERLRTIVKEEMEGAYPLDVPLRVDLRQGYNWYHMK